MKKSFIIVFSVCFGLLLSNANANPVKINQSSLNGGQILLEQFQLSQDRKYGVKFRATNPFKNTTDLRLPIYRGMFDFQDQYKINNKTF